MTKFCILPAMKLLYSRAEIDKQIERVAAEISRDYAERDPLFVGVLKGCTIFMAHLLVRLKCSTEIDFMTLSSYKHGTESGELKIIQDLDTPVRGRDVVVVEDILDTGKTLAWTIEHLKMLGAKSVEVALFVDKPGKQQYELRPAKYVCFEYTGDNFVTGFGFDFKEKNRNLPEIYELEESDKW